MIQLDSFKDSEEIDLDKIDKSKECKFVIRTILTMVLNLIQKFVIDVTGE